jgi:hypothetical protein
VAVQQTGLLTCPKLKGGVDKIERQDFLLCCLQIPVDVDLRFSYQELEEKAIMNAYRKRTESYKNRRVHLVWKRKNKKAASADPEYTYKPPDHCGHQECTNKMCVCVKNGVACNRGCGCKGVCGNFFNPEKKGMFHLN